MTKKIEIKGCFPCECGRTHRTKQVWDEPIPKDQKPNLTVCPRCKEHFNYWQSASKHAHVKRHYGDYNVYGGNL